MTATSFSETAQNKKAIPASQKISSPMHEEVSEKIPSLKADEFAIYLEDSYQIFKTKNFEKLELSESCFKNNKPNCIAYHVGSEKLAAAKLSVPNATNLAAINCQNAGGRSLVALDSKHNEYNFCRFSDGSMVTSWSMYFKHNPIPTIK